MALQDMTAVSTIDISDNKHYGRCYQVVMAVLQMTVIFSVFRPENAPPPFLL